MRELAAATLSVAVLATASVAASGEAQAKGKHRAAPFGGPMAMMKEPGGDARQESDDDDDDDDDDGDATDVQDGRCRRAGRLRPASDGMGMLGAPPMAMPFGQ